MQFSKEMKTNGGMIAVTYIDSEVIEFKPDLSELTKIGDKREVFISRGQAVKLSNALANEWPVQAKVVSGNRIKITVA